MRRAWAERSGEYSPAYYAYYGSDERSERVRQALDAHVDQDAAVLELGCSSGRHLAHLLAHGYTDLTGIEVNETAFDVMREVYPDLAARGTFEAAAIEAALPDHPDGRFDAVYSVETLQHVHPDAGWVFAEVARVTDALLVTVENEGDADAASATDPDVNFVREDVPLYHRNWRRVFSALEFEQVAVERGDRDTVRTFRPA